MTAAVVALAILLLALVLFLVRGFGVTHPRVHLGWLGAAAVALALIVSSWPE